MWEYFTARDWIVYYGVVFNGGQVPVIECDLGFENYANPQFDMTAPFFVVIDLSQRPALTPDQAEYLAGSLVTPIYFPVGAAWEPFAESLLQMMCPTCPTETAVEAPLAPGLPETVSIAAAPNPYNPHTTLQLTLPWPASVELELHNLRGQKLWSQTGIFAAGEYSLNCGETGDASGFQVLTVTGKRLDGPDSFSQSLKLLKLE